MHAALMAADMGGTEILPPLQAVFSTAPREGYARQVFLLTDGEVSNGAAIAALVRHHAADTRVFTFGIGSGASVGLCRDTATAGGGKAEMITEASNLQEAVLRQLSRALQPVVTDLSMYWGGLSVTQAPCVLRPLFHGEPYRVYGLVEDAQPQKRYLARLTGRLGGSSVHFDLVIEPSKCGAISACVSAPPGGPPTSAPLVIHRLASRELITDLEQGCSLLHLPRLRCAAVLSPWLHDPLPVIVLDYLLDATQAAKWAPDEAAVETEITRLGVKYSLVSKHTSFIAIEPRTNTQQTRPPPPQPKQSVVPASLTGAVSWRTSGLVYKKNEVFVDLVETVELEWGLSGGLRSFTMTGIIKMLCYLSGMPELLVGVNHTLASAIDKFHQSVRLSRFETDRRLSLVPPDGHFELVTYSIDPQGRFPVPLQMCVDASYRNSSLSILVKLVATIPKEKKALCKVTVPLGDDFSDVVMKPSKGSTAVQYESSLASWAVELHGGHSATLSIILTTPSPAHTNFANLAFEIPGAQCSQAGLTFLKVCERSGYEVRFSTRTILLCSRCVCPYRVRLN